MYVFRRAIWFRFGLRIDLWRPSKSFSIHTCTQTDTNRHKPWKKEAEPAVFWSQRLIKKDTPCKHQSFDYSPLGQVYPRLRENVVRPEPYFCWNNFVLLETAILLLVGCYLENSGSTDFIDYSTLLLLPKSVDLKNGIQGKKFWQRQTNKDTFESNKWC